MSKIACIYSNPHQLGVYTLRSAPLLLGGSVRARCGEGGVGPLGHSEDTEGTAMVARHQADWNLCSRKRRMPDCTCSSLDSGRVRCNR